MRIGCRPCGTGGKARADAAEHVPTAGYRRRAPSSTSGGAASAAGFGGLRHQWESLANRTQKTVIASTLGFMALVPVGAGQVMHPGFTQPTFRSPIAAQVASRGTLTSADQLVARYDAERARLTTTRGPAQEVGLRRLIEQSRAADANQKNSHALVRDADATLKRLGNSVGLDARMGYAVDVYWFGVPDNHEAFHQGKSAVGRIQQFDQNATNAAQQIRQKTRDTFRDVLAQESTTFHTQRERFRVIDPQLRAADDVVEQAKEARSALHRVTTAEAIRAATPQQTQQAVYRTKTTTVGSGTNARQVTTQVFDGYKRVPNPAYDAAVLGLTLAKSRAESAISDLNRAVETLQRTSPGVDLGVARGDLLNPFDFFRGFQWLSTVVTVSNVVTASHDIGRVEGAAQVIVDQLKPEHEQLTTAMERAIDQRWQQTEAGAVPNV
jgi:hypothetical protein